MIKKVKFLGVLLFLGLNFSCSPLNKEHLNSLKSSSKLIFTKGVTKTNLPIDNLNKVSLNNDKIYAYVAWRNLKKNKLYKYRCDIYDSKNTLLYSHKMDFNTQGHLSFNTWTWYTINKFVDEPGIWKAKVYLFNNLVIEKEILVEDK